MASRASMLLVGRAPDLSINSPLIVTVLGSQIFCPSNTLTLVMAVTGVMMRAKIGGGLFDRARR
ncbi:hypothetical protein BDV36DRAFT_263249 [Aspergillus pseudocaelatus]|uniref:Uncharacterized protein n=1 Tax=Aspergillus pseudocaelatus TaxID=1825620 RepID=A0ABQ6WI75_9EURO|nr:hypothetical protein BDV36DRAFT_263249 [Aspergillus pseudocaelatus]